MNPGDILYATMGLPGVVYAVGLIRVTKRRAYVFSDATGFLKFKPSKDVWPMPLYPHLRGMEPCNRVGWIYLIPPTRDPHK